MTIIDCSANIMDNLIETNILNQKICLIKHGYGFFKIC